MLSFSCGAQSWTWVPVSFPAVAGKTLAAGYGIPGLRSDAFLGNSSVQFSLSREEPVTRLLIPTCSFFRHKGDLEGAFNFHIELNPWIPGKLC